MGCDTRMSACRIRQRPIRSGLLVVRSALGHSAEQEREKKKKKELVIDGGWLVPGELLAC